MARAHFVKKARNAVPEGVCGIKGGIKPGDSYWWWKFRRGGKLYSKQRPRRSQLTGSWYYATIFDLEDLTIAKASADSGLGDLRDEIVSALEDLRDECQGNLDNMPEGLQQGPTGELLQQRVDDLENAISEFEDLELDEPDEDSFDESERQEGESDEDFKARMTQEYWDEKLEELQGISIEVN